MLLPLASRALAVLALAVALGACSTGSLVDDEPVGQLPDAYPYHTAEQIGAAIRASTAGVRSFSADGRIEIVAPRLEQRATYSIRSRVADSTTLNVRGPLGIEVARGVITPDSFLVYDKFNSKLYVGEVTAAERFVPGTGSSRVLAQAVVGLLAPEAGVTWAVTPDSGRYVMVHRRADRTRRVLIVNPSLWRVVQAQEIDATNTVIADQRFSAFDTIDGVVMPRRVVLVAPDQGIRLTMEHNNLSANPSDLRLRFKRPTGVETVPLD